MTFCTSTAPFPDRSKYLSTFPIPELAESSQKVAYGTDNATYLCSNQALLDTCLGAAGLGAWLGWPAAINLRMVFMNCFVCVPW